MKDQRVFVSSPDLSGNEERYVVDAVRSSWISSSGGFVTRFEREFADVAGTTQCISASNGTVALHVALVALGIGPGDEVIVPALTYVATANAVTYTGAEPVFVDVSEHTWCIDPGQIEDAITPRTRGIIAVDAYGHPADMDAINLVAERNGLWVLEDAAEAHTALYKGRLAGSLARVATFSFYGNKIITSGEGGAITTDDVELAARIRLLRGQGVDPERRYWFPVVGYNYRLTNVACAILCAQIERIDHIVARRREVFEAYRAGLDGIPGLGFQPVAEWAIPAPWLYCITVDEAAFGRSRDDLMAILDSQGIETRPFFFPLHRLPPYEARARERGANLPATDRLSASGMNLPTWTGLDHAVMNRICDAIRRAAI